MERSLFLSGDILVNLYTTREAADILSVYPASCVTTSPILRERVPMLEHPDTLISLAEGLRECPLKVHDIEVAGMEAQFLEWAIELPGNIAQMLAFAACDGHAVACDDHRIRASVQRLDPQLALLSTEDLLFNWKQRANPSDHRVIAALTAIEQNAAYTPVSDSASAIWWRTITKAISLPDQTLEPNNAQGK